MRGRKLGRNASHRKAMFRNMACSLIRSVRVDEDDPRKPKVPGRIVTTLPKAKELRPFVEKLITLARKAIEHEAAAEEFQTDAEPNSDEWRRWRQSEQWVRWAEARAPAVALRRRAFAVLRDKEAVDILFDELAERFEDRPGGYTRIVRLPSWRLGDAGQKALIEFVGERDRIVQKRAAPVVREEEELPAAESGEQEAETAESSEPESEDGGLQQDEAAASQQAAPEGEESDEKA